MSTGTETETTTESRGLLRRLRASPFLSELLQSRIAVAGLAIIATMVVVAVYSRVQMLLLAAPEGGLTSLEALGEAISAGPSPIQSSSARPPGRREGASARGCTPPPRPSSR